MLLPLRIAIVQFFNILASSTWWDEVLPTIISTDFVSVSSHPSTPRDVSLEEVPQDIFEEVIGPRLPPGSLARLSLVSKTLYKPAQSALSRNYKKDGRPGEETVFDVEKLYDLYHTIDDGHEKDAIKRLILMSLPEEISEDYVVQRHYDTCKRSLFTGDFMPTFPPISKEFPEVSRMLIKHKKYIEHPFDCAVHFTALFRGNFPPSFGSTFATLCTEPSFIQAFIESLGTVDSRKVIKLFAVADPRALRPIFQNLKPKPAPVKRILETNNFDFLIDHDETIDTVTMLQVISLVDDSNMDSFRMILPRFRFTNEWVSYTQNFSRFGHMKDVVIALLEFIPLSERDILTFIVDLQGHWYIIECYPVMRGKDTVESALGYLDSFVDGSFTDRIPDGLSPRTIFETALVYHFRDEVLIAIISLSGFYHDLRLVLHAVNAKLSYDVWTHLLKTESVVGIKIHFDLEYPTISAIDLEVFKLLVNNYFTLNKLRSFYARMDRNIPHKPYLEFLLAESKYAQDLDAFINTAFEKAYVDGPEMRRLITKFCFEKGTDFRWYLPGVPDEVAEFLENQKSDVLLRYIPAYLFKYPNTAQGYAAIVVLSRRSGIELLKRHLTGKDSLNFYLLFTHQLAPNLAADLVLSSYEYKAYLMKNYTGPSQSEYLDSVFAAICNHPDKETATEVISVIIIHKLIGRQPMCSIPELSQMGREHLQALIQSCREFKAYFKHPYYGPRLTEIYSQAGLMDLM